MRLVGAYRAGLDITASRPSGRGSVRGWLLSNNSSGFTQAAFSGFVNYESVIGPWNGTIQSTGSMGGSVEGVVTMVSNESTRCSVCSRCITSMAGAMQRMVLEANATTVASVFASACTASKRNSTICSQVQKAINASSRGNLGKQQAQAACALTYCAPKYK